MATSVAARRSPQASHARAVDERWSYKLSAGYFTQDPLPRPAGVIPNSFQTPYPPFENEGTSLADYGTFDDKVSDEVKAKLNELKAGIIAGDIKPLG